MVRCFSFIGPYTESDRDHIKAEQKRVWNVVNVCLPMVDPVMIRDEDNVYTSDCKQM
jgi:hypothetical protein